MRLRRALAVLAASAMLVAAMQPAMDPKNPTCPKEPGWGALGVALVSPLDAAPHIHARRMSRHAATASTTPPSIGSHTHGGDSKIKTARPRE